MSYVRIATLAAASMALFACRETVTCPEGTALAPGSGQCVPVPVDGGGDASVRDGGQDGGGDAGPCGACGAGLFCHESDGECVACLENDHCTEAPATLCDAGVCVQCLSYADCTDDEDAPACIAGACAPCASDADCGERTETPICDEASGRCVSCTRDTEEARCGTFTCSTVTHSCTTIERNTADSCDPCESDSQCIGGRRCVMHRFEATDVGYFCFRDAAADGCSDSNPLRRPYSTPTELTSIDGETAFYCMPPVTTTCRGLQDTRSTACTVDEDCGVVGLPDGYCPPGQTLCSYRCNGTIDCVGTLTCGGDPWYCRW